MFRKKMIGLTLATLMIGCMGASVSAHETDNVSTVSEIMPKGAICPDCGADEMVKKTETRKTINDYPCSHYNYGRDKITFVQELVYWKCADCGEETPRTVTNQYYITDCQGHD